MLFYSSEPIGPEYFLNNFGCSLKLSWDILDHAYQHRVQKLSCRLQLNQFILYQKIDPFYPMRGIMGQWSFFFRQNDFLQKNWIFLTRQNINVKMKIMILKPAIPCIIHIRGNLPIHLCLHSLLSFLVNLLCNCMDRSVILTDLVSDLLVASCWPFGKDGLYQVLHTNTIPNTILDKNYWAIPIHNTNTIPNLNPQSKLGTAQSLIVLVITFHS